MSWIPNRKKIVAHKYLTVLYRVCQGFQDWSKKKLKLPVSVPFPSHFFPRSVYHILKHSLKESLATAHLTNHPTPFASPTGAEPMGRWTHVATLGWSWPGSMDAGPATRFLTTRPTSRPCSKEHPQWSASEQRKCKSICVILYNMLCLDRHIESVCLGWPYQGHKALQTT